jgi:hypothetical protein
LGLIKEEANKRVVTYRHGFGSSGYADGFVTSHRSTVPRTYLVGYRSPVVCVVFLDFESPEIRWGWEPKWKDRKDPSNKNEDSIGSKAHRMRGRELYEGPSPLRGRSCPQADTQENGDEDKNYPQKGME